MLSIFRAALFACLVCVVSGVAEAELRERPNIVVILIDDLGYGDVGCYGSTTNRTPHIDRLAKEGLRFTDFHSNGPMCSPTRAALLTGCYQQRFGREFDSALGPGRNRSNGLPLDVVTIAELLQQSGYATGMFGKWHLGYKPPLTPARQGFGIFRGLMSGDGDHHTHINRSGMPDWWHNDQLQAEVGYTAELLTDHSVRFIGQNKSRPFFLYLAHLGIHFPWQGPDDPPHRRVGINYAQDKWGVIPDRKNVAPHVKSMVESIDRSVGRVVSALREHALSDNTLVVFSSDNGGYLNYASGGFENISSNGPLRGQKGGLEEGGHRVPTICSWPGKIAAGHMTDEVAMTMDLFPTFLKLAKVDAPSDQQMDGVDLGPLLTTGLGLPDRPVFWRRGNRRAARQGPWKLHLDEQWRARLYHLERDLGETRDVSADYPVVVKQLTSAYRAWELDVNGGYWR